MKKLNALTLLLLVIGGLNWGLIGLLDFNLVTYLFGGTLLTKIIYILVGLSALYQLKPCYEKCTN
ncbi:MAG: DUF378 domain-containing protein [Alphaproteobacteria bacterium]|nr:DUF378 domain-containing protein [Alphaproteobacteria bacterium]MBN2779623.1 DUF378 domain-containing protein [Alphaproteobacteria bacterium]